MGGHFFVARAPRSFSESGEGVVLAILVGFASASPHYEGVHGWYVFNSALTISFVM